MKKLKIVDFSTLPEEVFNQMFEDIMDYSRFARADERMRGM